MIFMLRQIQEKCREQNMSLYSAFVDLTKAFDTVSRDGLSPKISHHPLPGSGKAEWVSVGQPPHLQRR